MLNSVKVTISFTPMPIDNGVQVSDEEILSAVEEVVRDAFIDIYNEGFEYRHNSVIAIQYDGVINVEGSDI